MPVILSCTDGSTYAASVYDHTAWAAQRLAASVHVLHMLEHPERVPTDASGTIGIDSQAKLMSELVALAETQGRLAQAKARRLLDEAKRHLTDAGVTNIAIEQQHGALVDSIERFEATADLVVIGKRGEHADFAKGHLGSNLERVIRVCHHPVLVASRSFNPIERFLIAFDGGPSAKKAVAYVRSQPLLSGLHCHLVAASSSRGTLSDELAAAHHQLSGAGFRVTTTQTAGEPETVITEAVKQHGINLLVMGAYGHSRIRQFIVGSTTTTMVRTVQIPVLLFR
jgi:nucleotide-binding universal stress UspA family protein